MKVDRVTITGADNSVQPEDIIALGQEYPFTEWGILVSKSQEASRRFPSYSWVRKLYDLSLADPIKLSGHICGQWVRDICEGNWTINLEGPRTEWFDRIQLNFHALAHDRDKVKLIEGLKKHIGVAMSKTVQKTPGQVIFQIDDKNNDLFELARKEGINAVPLFDLSGGAGVLPEEWPKPRDCNYNGYAGGLSPSNLEEQLKKIEQVVGDRAIWIDVETLVRSNNDQQFDLDLVKKFIEVAVPWTK